jgi:hypothetical protein
MQGIAIGRERATVGPFKALVLNGVEVSMMISGALTCPIQEIS